MGFQSIPYRPPGWGQPSSAGLSPSEYFRLCKIGGIDPDDDYETYTQMQLINSLKKLRRKYTKKNIKLEIGRNENNLRGYIKIIDEGIGQAVMVEISEYDMQDEERIAARCMMALIKYGCTEDEAFHYMNNMMVTHSTPAKKPLPPIIKYDPTPVYILWMLASIPYIEEEDLSAYIISVNALERREAINSLSAQTKDEVTAHYRKYGTFAEKSWAYLNTFFKVWK